jgi:DNA-binding CsgD family transcriptional regulator
MVGVDWLEKNFFDNDSSEVEKLKNCFETTLKGVREEFDDHLESINDNTNEIQANYEYITKIDEKLAKLSERLGQIELLVARMAGVSVREEEDQPIMLNEKEKSVFLIIYTSSKPVTYSEIAGALNENEFIVRGYVTNMLEKGVPVQKRYVDNQVYLLLENSFKEKQAKLNLVGIRQKTVKEFLA